MSAATQYKLLLEKVASKRKPSDIESVYHFCRAKHANLGDSLLWAAAGGLPAYLLGSSIARNEEKQKHKNYALAGLAAGVAAPKVLNAILNPADAFPSASGFDASDIKTLQLESID